MLGRHCRQPNLPSTLKNQAACTLANRRELQQTEREMAAVEQAEQSEDRSLTASLNRVVDASQPDLLACCGSEKKKVLPSFTFSLPNVVYFNLLPGGKLSSADAAMRRQQLVTEVRWALGMLWLCGPQQGFECVLNCARWTGCKVQLPPCLLMCLLQLLTSPHAVLVQYYRRTGPAKVKEVQAHLQSLLEDGRCCGCGSVPLLLAAKRACAWAHPISTRKSWCVACYPRP